MYRTTQYVATCLCPDFISCSLSGDIDSEMTSGAVRKEQGMPVDIELHTSCI